jgi:hypothetical protein
MRMRSPDWLSPRHGFGVLIARHDHAEDNEMPLQPPAADERSLGR